jgi:hypothetical protein
LPLPLAPVQRATTQKVVSITAAPQVQSAGSRA